MPRNNKKQHTKCQKWPKCHSHLTGALHFNYVLHWYNLYYFRLVDVKISSKGDANRLSFVTKVAKNGLSDEASRKSTKLAILVHSGPFGLEF
jgi:hypothetical protein